MSSEFDDWQNDNSKLEKSVNGNPWYLSPVYYGGASQRQVIRIRGWIFPQEIPDGVEVRD
jgi:hypothetical protein